MIVVIVVAVLLIDAIAVIVVFCQSNRVWKKSSLEPESGAGEERGREEREGHDRGPLP